MYHRWFWFMAENIVPRHHCIAHEADSMFVMKIAMGVFNRVCVYVYYELPTYNAYETGFGDLDKNKLWRLVV